MDQESQLAELGWDEFFARAFEPFVSKGYKPARVIREQRDAYLVRGTSGVLRARVSGRLSHLTRLRSDYPAVGDWVAIGVRRDEKTATIHAVLERKTMFSRKVAGEKTDRQVLAANVDTVLVVCGLDGEFNLRRLERYLSSTGVAGARTVVVLNKADLAGNVEEVVREVRAVAGDCHVHVMSALEGAGLDALEPYLLRGKTLVFLGSSGVGKTTIINRLLGEERLRTGSVRASDGKGRHTTSSRELVVMPSGAIVIDTPGIREMQLWDDEVELEESFSDIEQLSTECRFSDCAHEAEPGCAVREAIDGGLLEGARWKNYLKLKDEIKRFRRRRRDAERISNGVARRRLRDRRRREDEDEDELE